MLEKYAFDYKLNKGHPRGIDLGSWLDRERLAVVVIDMQNYITKKKYSGKWSSGGQDNYYYNRINNKVLPNVKKIINFFRNEDVKIVYTRIASTNTKLLDVPGIGRKVLYNELEDIEGNKYHLNSKEYASRVDNEIIPKEGDMVVLKSSSGAFCSSNIDLILKANNISRLIFVGGMTDACVSSSVRQAYDRGYLPIVVEDGCIAATEDDHLSALKSIKKYYAWVTTTKDLFLKYKNIY
jgi:nicotinamidase-related amidase